MAFQLNLSPELESKLEAYCRKTGASKTGAVRLALESFLNAASVVPVKSKPVPPPVKASQPIAVSKRSVSVPVVPYSPIVAGKSGKRT